ncbi:WYL domain-containing protein [Methyloraptor flagellatus]|uniref:WYL domain-containing protein n=1 Tax=Methyloraptor flagellatus TaxID=3162530 RepID=A0AAU7XBD2_9HYPH
MGDPSTSESKPVRHARGESSARSDSAVVSRSQGRPSAAQGQSAEPGEALRWGVERRLAYLEQRLYWDGSVSRQALIDRFGISVNQASADFARYMEMAPGNMAYDGRAKRYRPTDGFVMRFGAPDTARFLAEVRARAEGLIEDAAASIPDPPAAEVVPLPVRAVDPAVLREVVRAIERGRGIAVTYRSFSTPGARRRVIEPHALVFDGTRWHARAGDPRRATSATSRSGA